jgi:hypothetical protein
MCCGYVLLRILSYVVASLEPTSRTGVLAFLMCMPHMRPTSRVTCPTQPCEMCAQMFRAERLWMKAPPAHPTFVLVFGALLSCRV